MLQIPSVDVCRRSLEFNRWAQAGRNIHFLVWRHMTRSVSHDRHEPVRRISDSRRQKIESILLSDLNFLRRGLAEEEKEEVQDEKFSFQMDYVSKPAIPCWKKQKKNPNICWSGQHLLCFVVFCCVLLLVYVSFSSRADLLMHQNLTVD